jgi:hypothetical protein
MNGWNYFNYFTEIEEYFWKKRGSHLLVSPLDWAIMETWQKAGVPLESVFKGIDRAFESYGRSRRGAGKPLKSLAYCTDAVLDAAEEAQQAGAGKAPSSAGTKASPFDREELRGYFKRNAASLDNAARLNAENYRLVAVWEEAIRALESYTTLLDSPGPLDVEDLERRLTLQDARKRRAAPAIAPRDGQRAGAIPAEDESRAIGTGRKAVSAKEAARGISHSASESFLSLVAPLPDLPPMRQS